MVLMSWMYLYCTAAVSLLVLLDFFLPEQLGISTYIHERCFNDNNISNNSNNSKYSHLIAAKCAEYNDHISYNTFII